MCFNHRNGRLLEEILLFLISFVYFPTEGLGYGDKPIMTIDRES
jgi:hypothetical protein